MSARTKSRLNAYCEEGFVAGRYDFRAGRKIKAHLERAGLAARVLSLLIERENKLTIA